MKRFVFILLILCAVLLAPLDTFANDGASAVDKADMIYVDESFNGLYQLYYKDQQWYIYHTATGNLIDLWSPPETAYAFHGKYVEQSTIDYEYGRLIHSLIDPQTLDRIYISTKNASSKYDKAYYFDCTIDFSWHEASGSYVVMYIVGDNSAMAQSDGVIWLDFYDLEWNLTRSVKTPLKQANHASVGGSNLLTAYNQFYLRGDYAVFYSWDSEHNRRITFYNVHDGTYWFGNGEIFRAIGDCLVILDYDYDDNGNVALQAELYVNGICVNALWLPVSKIDTGDNFIFYNNAENLLVCNRYTDYESYYVFDFGQSMAYQESGGQYTITDLDFTSDPQYYY